MTMIDYNNNIDIAGFNSFMKIEKIFYLAMSR